MCGKGQGEIVGRAEFNRRERRKRRGGQPQGSQRNAKIFGEWERKEVFTEGREGNEGCSIGRSVRLVIFRAGDLIVLVTLVSKRSVF